jgi:membrane-associated phospholipid phosphatase
MNSRYLTNVSLALASGFLIVVSQAFAAPVFEWLMLAIGVVAVLISGAIVLRTRGRAQRALDAITGLLGAWTIIASLVFAGSVMTALGFASGLAFAALALAGLTLHELHTERVVHSIEVRAAAPEGEFAGAH